jgi:hypothetical protein
MEIDASRYLSQKQKTPPHEKAAVVNLFLSFIRNKEEKEKYQYGFWLRKVGDCKYGKALEILKELETLPIQYNQAGAIINRLKKFNELSKRGKVS